MNPYYKKSSYGYLKPSRISPPEKVSDSDKTRNELNARKQLGKFDDHFNDPNTTVRLDLTSSSKNGKKKKRYIISQNGDDKYTATFKQKDGKMKLERVVSIKYKHQKPKITKK